MFVCSEKANSGLLRAHSGPTLWTFEQGAHGSRVRSCGMVDARFINRELSWLAFDERVLDLATEVGIPLLERAKFCAITSSTLDEFFQVRVAALKDQVAARIEEPTPDGRTASQQLGEIAEATRAPRERQELVFLDSLVPRSPPPGSRWCAGASCPRPIARR